MTLGIGLLFGGGFAVPPPFVLGLCDLLQAIFTGALNTELPSDQQIERVQLITSQGFPVDAARNDICRSALADPMVEALLFLDADMRHPRDLPARLLRHRVDLVTARYQMRRAPFRTCAMRKTGQGKHAFQAIEDEAGLVPIDRGGAGALLIRRSVLEAIRARLRRDEWFRYQMGPDGLRNVSEDFWLYEQAQAAGIQPWCDLDTVCTHVGQFEIDPDWHRPWAAAYQAVREGAA